MPRKRRAAGRGPSSSGVVAAAAADAAPADEDTTADTTTTDASGGNGAVGAGRSKSKSKTKAAAKSTPRRSPARRGRGGSKRADRGGGRKSYSEKDDDAEFERMLAGGDGSSDDGGDDDESTNQDTNSQVDEEKEEAKKKTPAAKSASSSSFMCGLCNKSFKAKPGLDYHMKNQVCQRKKDRADADIGDDDGGASLQKKKTTAKKPKPRSRSAGKAKGDGGKAKDKDKAPPYRCPKCDRSFKQQHGLDYHVKRNVCQDGTIKTPPNQSRGGKGGKFGPIDMRTCPYCQRVFSIVSGLAYHLQHKVCQKAAGDGGCGGGGGGRKSGGQKKKGGARAKVTREERSLAGTAPFPPLQPGQRFVTQYGVVEVVADDRIPDDYGTTKIAGYDAAKVRGGVDEAKLVQLGRDCQRYKRSKEREKEREERLWAQRVRSNLRKRRRLGRHYAQEAGLEPAGGAAASTAPADGGRPLTMQMVVWQESVSTKTLTPDTILNYGATYKPPRDVGDVMGITFSAKGGIKEEEGAAHPAPAKVPQAKIGDPLVPANSYPDRIVTCRLVPDRRKRIYDHSARLASAAASASGNTNDSGSAKGGAPKSTETAWDIVLKAKEDAKRSQQDEAGVENTNKGEDKASAMAVKSNGDGGSSGEGGEEKKEDEESKQEEEGERNETEGPAASPIIATLCLRRCLLTEPYNASRPVFICRDCGKILKTREGLREHVLTRVCQPPEPETDESSEEEEEEAANEDIKEPVASKTTNGGITLRAQRKRKRKTYVEISSDDEEGGDGGGSRKNKKKKGKRKKADDDDDEWDATAAGANAQDDDDDDDISVVSEKEDDGPVEVEVPDDNADMLVVDAVPPSSSKKGKKRSRSSLASLASGKSRSRGHRGGNNRSAALADFDPDDDSSVEMMSVVSRSHKTPVKAKFGVDPDRRLSRKEWKRLKRPGWMQFKPEASSWYPEIMKCLSIKRGSNNQNWKRLKTERKRFEPVKNVRRERKAKQRLGDGPIYPSVIAKLSMWEGIQNKTIYPNVFENLGFDKSRNAPRTRSMRPRSTTLELFGDEDKNYERRDQQAKRLERERERAQGEINIEEQPKPSKRRKRVTKVATTSTVVAFSSSSGTTKVSSTGNKSGRAAGSRKRKKKPNPPPTTLPDGGNDVTSTNFTINSFKMAGGPMIDLNVLVEEVDAGRFPSMKRYEEDDHIDVCEICHETSDDGERGPVYCCAFCPNAEHFSCLKSRYNVHEWDEDDDFMCHSCLATCLHRRHRAERRRLGQIDDRKSKKKKTSTAGDDYVAQDDDGFSAMDVDDDNSINVGDVNKGHENRQSAEISEMPPLPPAASEAQRKSDIDLGNISHQMPPPACPSGGPGGLICCSHCATSYSQILANTTKEIEAQTVEKVGQEVGELMEMLRDAQTRLRLAVDVSKENDVRRRAI